MFVSDYMTPDPLVVSTRERMSRLAELIRTHGIRQIPVVDNANRLVGIVTDRDLQTAVDFDQKGKANLVAEEIMSVDLVTIAPGASLTDAAYLLCEHRFSALPVVVGEHIVGMISTRDLLRRLIELSEDQLPVRRSYQEPAYPF